MKTLPPLEMNRPGRPAIGSWPFLEIPPKYLI
jgi:hypothetical protein